MKVHYFLAPDVKTAQNIAKDIEEQGVDPMLMHVISDDSTALIDSNLNRSNWFETLDLFRLGIMGASLGAILGVVFSVLLSNSALSEGLSVPLIAHAALIMLFILFGTWVGGLLGVATKNYKNTVFEKDIKKNKCVLMVYTPQSMISKILTMMNRSHPEAPLAASDSHFLNPFKSIQRVDQKAA